MALKGVKVIELAGLAPAPFCGMVLADFGASVVRIDKIGAYVEIDCLANGKMSVAINLKHNNGINVLKNLCKEADVLVEPFRKGVMESLGIGPDILLKNNPKLIYARLTGYGQNGVYSNRAGHDINYIAMSGLLSAFGRFKEKPIFPTNIIADFGGGGLMCAMGIVLALYERQISGKGQVIDCNMVEGSGYLGSWIYRSQHLPVWGKPTGQNILDSGAPFYETYETKDGKFMAVGAIEPQFYSCLIKGLRVSEDEISRLDNFEEIKKLFASKFSEKTQQEWCEIFDDQDACVTPVLSLTEAPEHRHNVERKSFIKDHDGKYAPNIAPKLSRTPGTSQSNKPAPIRGQHTTIVLQSLGYTTDQIQKLEQEGAIEIHKSIAKL